MNVDVHFTSYVSPPQRLSAGRRWTRRELLKPAEQVARSLPPQTLAPDLRRAHFEALGRPVPQAP